MTEPVRHALVSKHFFAIERLERRGTFIFEIRAKRTEVSLDALHQYTACPEAGPLLQMVRNELVLCAVGATEAWSILQSLEKIIKLVDDKGGDGRRRTRVEISGDPDFL